MHSTQKSGFKSIPKLYNTFKSENNQTFPTYKPAMSKILEGPVSSQQLNDNENTEIECHRMMVKMIVNEAFEK